MIYSVFFSSAAALTGDVESVPPTTCHAPSLMEVEVLLYNCHQHTTEVCVCVCVCVCVLIISCMNNCNTKCSWTIDREK